MQADATALDPRGLPLTEAATFAVDIETASGSRYRVTWSAEDRRGTLTRSTAVERDVHPLSRPLRRDGELLPLVGFDRIDLGHRTTFIVDVRSDGVLTTRWANQSVRIEGLGWDINAAAERTTDDVAGPGNDHDGRGLVSVHNGVLRNVHPPAACADQPWGCWIHQPLPHRLDRAPVRWREDRNTAERICEHGIGHPDPQDAAYWWNTHGRDITIHGCDGCCGPRPEWTTGLLPSGRARSDSTGNRAEEPGRQAQAALRERRWRDAERAQQLWTADDIAAFPALADLGVEEVEARLRDLGALGIQRHGVTRYPRCQFTYDRGERLCVSAAWADLRDRFTSAGWHPEDFIAWALAPNGWLNGRTPAEEIEHHPDELTDPVAHAITQATVSDRT